MVCREAVVQLVAQPDVAERILRVAGAAREVRRRTPRPIAVAQRRDDRRTVGVDEVGSVARERADVADRRRKAVSKITLKGEVELLRVGSPEVVRDAVQAGCTVRVRESPVGEEVGVTVLRS